MRDFSELDARTPPARRFGGALLVVDLLAALAITWQQAAVVPAVLMSAVVLFTIGSHGGYQRRISGRLGQTFGWVIAAVAIGTLAVAMTSNDAQSVAVIDAAPLILATMVAGRIVVFLLQRASTKRRAPAEQALVVGAGATGVQLIEHLREHPEYGLEPVGFVDRVTDEDLPIPLLGDVDDLEFLVQVTGARQVIIAFGLVPEDELVTVIRRCQVLDVDVWVVPRFFELGVGRQRADNDEVWGIPLSRLPRLALRSTEWRAKRIFDCVASGAAIALMSPVFVLASIAVKLSSPGPIFFRQVRIGQRGRDFELLKFRTMRVNDDSGTTWSVAADDRVTPIGRILRRTCIDELPQFLNVLRGDMSLVGPRPERPHFVDIFRGSVRRYDDRHRVPVGLTGLAQVNGLRGDTSIEQRAMFDNNYIENWTLWSDIVILFRTVAAVVLHSPDAVKRSPAPTESSNASGSRRGRYRSRETDSGDRGASSDGAGPTDSVTAL